MLVRRRAKLWLTPPLSQLAEDQGVKVCGSLPVERVFHL